VISKRRVRSARRTRSPPELARAGRWGCGWSPWLSTSAKMLFSHPDFKDERARWPRHHQARPRRWGIILILATQRPDAKSLPTGVSANVGIRFCLRVMGQTENAWSWQQIILTAADATCSASGQGIGYLVGAGDSPEMPGRPTSTGPVRSHRPRALRGLREKAGTLTRARPGETTEPRGPAPVDPVRPRGRFAAVEDGCGRKPSWNGWPSSGPASTPSGPRPRSRRRSTLRGQAPATCGAPPPTASPPPDAGYLRRTSVEAPQRAAGATRKKGSGSRCGA